MRCPQCNKATAVKDSRPVGKTIKRRRECIFCNHRFSTVEKMFVVKKPVKSVNKTKPVVKKARPHPIDDWEDMTDDELETAIFEGRVSFDE